MKFIHLFIFLLLSISIHCQNKITGQCFYNDIGLKGAKIYCYNNDNKSLVATSTSDSSGFWNIMIKDSYQFLRFEFKYPNLPSGNIIVANNKKSLNVNYEFFVQKDTLNEIVIKDKNLNENRHLTLQKDKIVYKLDHIADSTMFSLKDYLTHLRGIEVSSDGQISFNGSHVRNLIIGNDSLFSNQHGWAQKVIPADIIDSINLTKKEGQNWDLIIKLKQNKNLKSVLAESSYAVPDKLGLEITPTILNDKISSSTSGKFSNILVNTERPNRLQVNLEEMTNNDKINNLIPILKKSEITSDDENPNVENKLILLKNITKFNISPRISISNSVQLENINRTTNHLLQFISISGKNSGNSIQQFASTNISNSTALEYLYKNGSSSKIFYNIDTKNIHEKNDIKWEKDFLQDIYSTNKNNYKNSMLWLSHHQKFNKRYSLSLEYANYNIFDKNLINPYQLRTYNSTDLILFENAKINNFEKQKIEYISVKFITKGTKSSQELKLSHINLNEMLNYSLDTQINVIYSIRTSSQESQSVLSYLYKLKNEKFNCWINPDVRFIKRSGFVTQNATSINYNLTSGLNYILNNRSNFLINFGFSNLPSSNETLIDTTIFNSEIELETNTYINQKYKNSVRSSLIYFLVAPAHNLFINSSLSYSKENNLLIRFVSPSLNIIQNNLTEAQLDQSFSFNFTTNKSFPESDLVIKVFTILAKKNLTIAQSNNVLQSISSLNKLSLTKEQLFNKKINSGISLLMNFQKLNSQVQKLSLLNSSFFVSGTLANKFSLKGEISNTFDLSSNVNLGTRLSLDLKYLPLRNKKLEFKCSLLNWGFTNKIIQRNVVVRDQALWIFDTQLPLNNILFRLNYFI